MKDMRYLEDVVSLIHHPERCNGCGACMDVCPHAVWALDPERDGGRVRIVDRDACIECGACQLNCPTGAARVNSGVGCATALLNQALGRTTEACCGPTDDGQSGCC